MPFKPDLPKADINTMDRRLQNLQGGPNVFVYNLLSDCNSHGVIDLDFDPSNRILSAHRTPQSCAGFLRRAEAVATARIGLIQIPGRLLLALQVGRSGLP